MSDEPKPDPVSFDDIVLAAHRLEPVVRRTPLLSSSLIDQQLGARLLLKAEPLQHTGSFKFRGAYNAIVARQASAVVAYSSGNHAQGVALAASIRGIPASIVMPADAPMIKREHTERYGARVHAYDRYREIREQVGEKLVADMDAELIRPYDDHFVIAGQGTVGLEVAEQCAELDLIPDVALVCTGGGGLIAGCALALQHHFPAIQIYAVEPEGFDDTARSLAAGQRVKNEPNRQSFCDALLTTMPGEITFEINRKRLAGGLIVDDGEVGAAMGTAFRHYKLVVEPGGAVALAAVLSGKIDVVGKKVVAVATGGNVDEDLFARIIASNT